MGVSSLLTERTNLFQSKFIITTKGGTGRVDTSPAAIFCGLFFPSLGSYNVSMEFKGQVNDLFAKDPEKLT